MTGKRRNVVRIVGFVLVAVALCVIGYSAYNLITTDIETQDSLQEAEQYLVAASVGTMSPDASLPQYADASGQPQAGSVTDETAAPGQGDGGSDEALDPGLDDGTYSDEAGLDPFTQDDPSGGTVKSPGGTSRPKPVYKPKYLGVLVLKSLGGRKVPVLEGVTNRDLSRGGAHHPRTSPAGGVGNCVIFGHRNTVFRGFGKLKVGDTILLETPGKTYTYAIQSMAVVNPDDSRIFQTYDQAIMTLVTCYPFNYVGAAPQRYIVVAALQ